MTLRCALIGTGNMANSYVQAIATSDDWQLNAVVSRNQQRAAIFAEQNGIAHSAASIDAIVEHCDALIAVGPSGLHGQLAQQAAARGKHILVEKPLDITPAAMDAAITACHQAGVQLAVAYQRRYRPLNQALKQLIDNGELGTIRAVHLDLKFFRGDDYYQSAAWRGTPELDGGGPFMQQASHDIDLLCWLCGQPTGIMARTATLGHEGLAVEDHGGAIADLPGGGLATMVASTICAPGYAPRFELFTDRGSVIIENDTVTSWNFPDIAQPQTEIHANAHNAATSATVQDTSAHQSLLHDFAHAVKHNVPALTNGVSARMATDVICALYQSATTGTHTMIGSQHA